MTNQVGEQDGRRTNSSRKYREMEREQSLGKRTNSSKLLQTMYQDKYGQRSTPRPWVWITAGIVCGAVLVGGIVLWFH